MGIGRAALVLLVSGMSAQAACREGTLELQSNTGAVSRFSVEVADDARERSKGLMHRESMATAAGMLFVYERPENVSFWMENTLIPLDMIFADPTGTVKHVHQNAVPLDRTPIPGGANIKYVLEMAFQLDEEGWRGLSLRWGLFFIFLAVVNEVVWRHSTTAFWVGFKLYGMFTMNILFWLAHAPYIQKHMIKTPDQPQS